MEMLNDAVSLSVQQTLNKKKLFRYDCQAAGDSEVAILEKKFANIVGSEYAVAMNSCSSALYVSLLCAGVEKGDKVAVPAFTFIAVPSAIVHAGAQPVLVEVTNEYVIDPEDLELKVKGGSVKVLLLSYMRGRIPNLDAIVEICSRYNVILLEDSAHSLGITYRGKQTGTFGLTGAFSAQSYKMIDGGEGGILVTNDKMVAFKAMLYAGCYEHNWKKHFGTEGDYETLVKMTSTIPAYNFRMSNLSAAALLPQLDCIDERVEHFNVNYQLLVDMLQNCKYIRIPRFVEGVGPAPDSVQWEFIHLSPEKIDAIISDLDEQGIKMDIFQGKNARCFWNWKFFEQEDNCCSYTRNLVQNTIDMRLWLSYSANDIKQIGEKILKTIDNYV